MTGALATWSCSAQLIRLWLTMPEWRSCHERSIRRNQLEPAEESLRRHTRFLACTLPRHLCGCRNLAKPNRDGRDATHSRARNRGILAAERGGEHRAARKAG